MWPLSLLLLPPCLPWLLPCLPHHDELWRKNKQRTFLPYTALARVLYRSNRKRNDHQTQILEKVLSNTVAEAVQGCAHFNDKPRLGRCPTREGRKEGTPNVYLRWNFSYARILPTVKSKGVRYHKIKSVPTTQMVADTAGNSSFKASDALSWYTNIQCSQTLTHRK